MKFCDNPSCQNHLEVSDHIFLSGILRRYITPTEIREVFRHEFIKGPKTLSICDWCNNAIDFFTGYPNTPK